MNHEEHEAHEEEEGIPGKEQFFATSQRFFVSFVHFVVVKRLSP